MSESFQIQIDFSEGALQRLIGLVERRGFHIERMSVAEVGGQREVRLCVRGRDATRRTEVLGRQIDRLVGVRRTGGASSMVEEVAPCPA